MAYDFNGKKVWVTGASSGIGRCLADQLHEKGAHVFVSARNTEKLSENFSGKERITILPGDLTSADVNKNIVADIKASAGGLDCVIFNAGTAEYVDAYHFSAAPFERMIEANYFSMIRGIEAALPLLKESENAYLVGMSSSVGWQGLPSGQAYSASKAAIRNLFQGLKIELAPKNIAVSWICPGFVKTPLTDKNTFDMPFRVSTDEAAHTIVKQLMKQTTEIHFPKRFTYFLKFVSCLPAGLAAKILSKTVPESS